MHPHHLSWPTYWAGILATGATHPPTAPAAAAEKEEDEQAGAAGMDVDVAGKEGGLPGSGAEPAE